MAKTYFSKIFKAEYPTKIKNKLLLLSFILMILAIPILILPDVNAEIFAHCSGSNALTHRNGDTGLGDYRHYRSGFSWLVENCAAKASTDSDGSSTAYTTAGTVTDYLTCSRGSCTSNSYSDSCSGNTLTEYAASGSTYTSGTKNCEDYEEYYCSGDRQYRREWGCSGTPSNCNDASVPDTRQGTNEDGDAKDLQCGDSLCDNAAGVYDSTKTSTETNCADGLDNDCDGAVDCADSDCDGSIQGTVKDSNNEPIQLAIVRVYRYRGSAIKSAITNNFGEYNINSIKCGDYYLVTFRRGFFLRPIRISIAPNQEAAKDFKLDSINW